MDTHDILTLIKVHLIIGRRLSIETRGRFILSALYLLFCADPLLIVYGHPKYGNSIISITLLAFWNFMVISLIRMRTKLYFQLHQLKVYPISDRAILHLLWITELLDYNMLALIIPALGCIILLYPNLSMVVLYVAFVSSGYLLLSLIILEIKLVASYSRLFRGAVIASAVVGIVILAESLVNMSKWEFEHVAKFVIDWGVLVPFIAALSLLTLYEIATVILSRLVK